MSDDSILANIKNTLGVPPGDTSFDPELILYINSVFSSLFELGVGPDEGFSISDVEQKWVDFMPPEPRLNHVKTYMAMRVKQLFDPPEQYPVVNALQAMIDKEEWHITNTAYELKNPPIVVVLVPEE